MKSIDKISVGFRDAENYKMRQNKEFFNSLFLRTESLASLCDGGKFFLVGEKGTGKTAYAVYLSNNDYKNNYSSIKYIRETEYNKFLNLKSKRHLDLSGYTSIWKVILYLLISNQIIEKESNVFISAFGKFKSLKNAIEEYYDNAFSPEMIYAIQFAEEAQVAAEILSRHAKAGAKASVESKVTSNKYQVNLLFIQRKFEEALSSLKLSHNHILFVDGIDIRPSGIPYNDYIECVKGLANAVWSINSDFFSNIRDSNGRLRVVMLIRPDIFDSLGLQNQNSKIRDNSVVLNWITRYPEHRTSQLFLMADKLLRVQQTNSDSLKDGEAWDNYFPYDTSRLNQKYSFKTSFVSFLRYSLYRPRDIMTILSIQQENIIEEGRGRSEFKEDDFISPAFTRKYSDYLLGEVKDHLSFYYTANDYELFLNFFHFLKGSSRFSYEFFNDAFNNYVDFLQRENNEKIPVFCKSGDAFLQFLYDLNIICYVRDTDIGPFFSYCYRDRCPSNIAPKVEVGVRYEVHYGLMKALSLGKRY